MLKFKSVAWVLSLAMAAVSLTGLSDDASAKRLAAGKPAGMQRQAPAQPAQNATPAQQAAPHPAAPAPQAPGKRSWMGPLAGLAAGIGIAALLGHFGLGGAVADFMGIALMALVALLVVGWLIARFRKPAAPANSPMQFAGAGAPWSAAGSAATSPAPAAGFNPGFGSSSAVAPLAAVPATRAPDPALMAELNTPDFLRISKMIFIRLQAANDAGDVDDLRRFTTPELFSSFRVDIQERGTTPQQTDVVQVDCAVVDAAREPNQQVVSVRFHGLIREEAGSAPVAFDEIWHLVRPAEGNRDWLIAGITPTV